MADKDYITSRVSERAAAVAASTATGDESGISPGEFGSARRITCTVDFGTSDGVEPMDGARTTVLAGNWQQWISVAGPRPICEVVGRPDVSGVDDEDALIEGVRVRVCNIVDGVSFDVVAHAADGATGLFTVQIMGV